MFKFITYLFHWIQRIKKFIHGDGGNVYPQGESLDKQMEIRVKETFPSRQSKVKSSLPVSFHCDSSKFYVLLHRG